MRKQENSSDDRYIKRRVSGPLGPLAFGQNWLAKLNLFDYRDYLCRAFGYCDLKQRYRGEEDPRERRLTLEKLKETIQGVLAPEMPSSEKLKLYFECNRFPITKIAKKSKSREIQRWVIISTSDFKMHYYKKEEGGVARSKTYNISRVKFTRKFMGDIAVMEIQPEQRPHGPLTITNTAAYVGIDLSQITKLSNNIKCLKNAKSLAGQLELFLKVYNYSITKRLLERFVDVHLCLREKVVASQKTVQELEDFSQAGQKGAVAMLREVLKNAHAEWREFDNIHPPHFVGRGAQTQEGLKEKLKILSANGALGGHNLGAEEGFSFETLEIRNA